MRLKGLYHIFQEQSIPFYLPNPKHGRPKSYNDLILKSRQQEESKTSI